MKYTLADIGRILDESKTDTGEEPFRLLNGSGKCFPGLENINIDLLPPLIFTVLYRTCSEEEIRLIEKQIRLRYPKNPLLIQDRSVRPAVTRYRSEDLPEEVIITENGLNYLLNPLRGQNPGFFPDMREGRKLVSKTVKESETEHPRVLNLFAYTCSFSVAALAAGAGKVVNIDMNRRSLDIGKRNHRLNHQNIPGGYTTQALFLPHDIFKSWGKLKKEGPYDLIIADPPPSQKGSFKIERDYPKLIRRLPDMVTQKGRLLLTWNGPDRSWEEFEEMAFSNLPAPKTAERIAPPKDFAPREDGRGLKLLCITL